METEYDLTDDKVAFLPLSDTKKRYAYIGKNLDGYYVELKDWEARLGGSYEKLRTVKEAIELGNKFLSGADFYFAPENGLKLI